MSVIVGLHDGPYLWMALRAGIVKMYASTFTQNETFRVLFGHDTERYAMIMSVPAIFGTAYGFVWAHR